MSEKQTNRTPRDRSSLDHRIEALEQGIKRWRCLTAVGFLTALGAFSMAVFGVSQLENTYFIGEMVETTAGGASSGQGGKRMAPAMPEGAVVLSSLDEAKKPDGLRSVPGEGAP